jgi:seryl-tRNA synthetase
LLFMKTIAKVSCTTPSLVSDARLTQTIAQYSATQINTKINEIQKQIGAKKKAKENADDLMKQKLDLEKEKKALIEAAAEKDVALKKKIGTIGNIVHESVPVNDNEVLLQAAPLKSTI